MRRRLTRAPVRYSVVGRRSASVRRRSTITRRIQQLAVRSSPLARSWISRKSCSVPYQVIGRGRRRRTAGLGSMLGIAGSYSFAFAVTDDAKRHSSPPWNVPVPSGCPTSPGKLASACSYGGVGHTPERLFVASCGSRLSHRACGLLCQYSVCSAAGLRRTGEH